jgi:hypothetical protein
MRAKLSERFASIGGLGDHSHIRYILNKRCDTRSEQRVIVD